MNLQWCHSQLGRFWLIGCKTKESILVDFLFRIWMKFFGWSVYKLYMTEYSGKSLSCQNHFFWGFCCKIRSESDPVNNCFNVSPSMICGWYNDAWRRIIKFTMVSQPIDLGWLVVGSGSIDLLLLETLIDVRRGLGDPNFFLHISSSWV